MAEIDHPGRSPVRAPGPAAKPRTLAAQGGERAEDASVEVIPPIHVSTTYYRDPDGGYRSGRVYARPDNPTFDAPEALITALEGGAATLVFASGMAAATTVFMALAPGDHVLAPRVMYWSLRNWLAGFATHWGLSVDFVEMGDVAAVTTAIRPGRTKLLWVETPANPLWTVSDIAALATLAHGAGARLAVDSTCATPVLTRPIEHGADLVMHSATKYLNGHSDVIAGTLTTAALDEDWQKIRAVRYQGGSIPGPFEAALLLRGLRTLFVRVEASCRSAERIAKHFHGHPLVSSVLYPGLPDAPDHAIARRQMVGGFGGMLSIRVAAGAEAAIATAARVRLWHRATSLGGVESLIEHRASIEGPTSPVPPDLLRLSVGLEDAEDLIDDLEAALSGAAR